ncbi:MAG: SIR2 family protein [Actinomycetota bacterium]|nr:SIR2 family protein [Actinomycetota bacterium]
MPLDPIVSLSVALAEAPGTCAFFLGSGVSRDAGVPTGQQIMRDGLRKLHQLETESAEPAVDAELDTWLLETGREHITYSELLELITPDQGVRREYLAAFFEGREPGRTHEMLAGLAERGLARVFITTNFDRLLEHALQARGIEPVVIASDADLHAAVPREHADCIVLKPHGDYLRQTIRNTPEELAALEPGVTAELGEVFNRYGVVVLGYSGADEAIAQALRARQSRYGLWWVARGEPGQPAVELVEATAGRVITRDTAADFLADLDRRLSVFEAHPSGLTPAVVHDSFRGLLRANDRVGLDEDLRRERHWFEEEIERIAADARARHPNEDGVMGDVWHALRPVLERRVACLLPLGLHDIDRFDYEIGQLSRTLERRPLSGGFTVWSELGDWAASWLGYVSGALLVRLERYEALAPLLTSTWTDRNGYTEQLVWLPGETGHTLGVALAPQGQRWLSPAWEFLTSSLETMDWLCDRYPELFAEGEPRRSMGQFDMLVCIRCGLIEHRAIAFFSLASDGAAEFSLRLHRDARLRERIASVFDLSLDEFDAVAPSHLRKAEAFRGGFTDHGVAANILEHGRAHL